MGLTEPHVRLSTTPNGPERTAEIRQLEARPAPPRFTAYAHLILDMLNTNPMLFSRLESPTNAGQPAHGAYLTPAAHEYDRRPYLSITRKLALT